MNTTTKISVLYLVYTLILLGITTWKLIMFKKNNQTIKKIIKLIQIILSILFIIFFVIANTGIDKYPYFYLPIIINGLLTILFVVCYFVKIKIVDLVSIIVTYLVGIINCIIMIYTTSTTNTTNKTGLPDNVKFPDDVDVNEVLEQKAAFTLYKNFTDESVQQDDYKFVKFPEKGEHAFKLLQSNKYVSWYNFEYVPRMILGHSGLDITAPEPYWLNLTNEADQQRYHNYKEFMHNWFKQNQEKTTKAGFEIILNQEQNQIQVRNSQNPNDPVDIIGTFEEAFEYSPEV